MRHQRTSSEYIKVYFLGYWKDSTMKIDDDSVYMTVKATCQLNRYVNLQAVKENTSKKK